MGDGRRVVISDYSYSVLAPLQPTLYLAAQALGGALIEAVAPHLAIGAHDLLATVGVAAGREPARSGMRVSVGLEDRKRPEGERHQRKKDTRGREAPEGERHQREKDTRGREAPEGERHQRERDTRGRREKVRREHTAEKRVIRLTTHP